MPPEDPKQAQQQTQAPTEVTVKDVHGNSVTLPLARVQELAGLGLDADQRRQEVEAARRELEASRTTLASDERQYRAFLQLRDQADTNPQFAAALRAAVQNPDLVLQALRSADPDDDDEDEDEPKAGKSTRRAAQPAAMSPEVLSEIGTLKNAVSTLSQTVSSQTARERQEQTARLLDTELQAYPWLTGKALQKAREGVLSKMKEANHPSLTVLVAKEVDDIKGILQASGVSAIERTRARASLASVDPSKGGSGMTAPQKMDRNAFKDGTMEKATKAALNDFFRGAFQGE